MQGVSKTSYFFATWVAAVIVLGGALTSYHQPFRLPEAGALARVLAKDSSTIRASNPRWAMTHLVSGNCGCSRRVMQHLLHRQPLPGVLERIVLVESQGDSLPGTGELLSSLRNAGFHIARITEAEISASSGFHGVPLLMVTSPQGKVDYLGGYGPMGDKDIDILGRVRSGSTVTALPVLGCAVGTRTKRLSDPFRLKY